MTDIFSTLTTGQIALLCACLGLAFAFEFVNGFHDTANAVATVIYTRSLRATPAVVWSGICNMLGILLGGVGVAFTIVHLLPVDLLVNINTNLGLLMVLSLLGSAILWNFGTWYLGLPASSSHALIGAILGVGLANSFIHGRGFSGVNLSQVGTVGLSLLLSPLIGFGLSALLVKWLRRTKPSPVLHQPPVEGDRPPGWIRGVLIATCTGVSFAHGSNDGQKGMGLVMLILIGIAPAHFALNLEHPEQYEILRDSTVRVGTIVSTRARQDFVPGWRTVSWTQSAQRAQETERLVQSIERKLSGKSSFLELTEQNRWHLRQEILELDGHLKSLRKAGWLSAEEEKEMTSLSGRLMRSIEYVPRWVVIMTALCLGLGTMIGWKRIVVTVGEKIGKTHLTYSQGASAELVAMSTIGLADVGGLPVSTTHVLSSGVAGTMWASRSGVNLKTIQGIALAWILTLPACMFLSAGIFLLARNLIGG